MEYIHTIQNKKSLDFCEDLRLSKFDDGNITVTNFSEISNYTRDSFVEYCPEIVLYPQFFENVVASISEQLFDLLKIPLLYSVNKICEEKEIDILQINKKELFKTVFEQYKEIERLFYLLSEQQFKYFSNLFVTLIEEKETIYSEFQIKGIPVSVVFPLGDFHNKGNTHSIINYNCGKSIIYKTKNYGCALIAEEFVKKLFNKGHNIPFYFPKRLLRDKYYWEEYVDYEPVLDYSKAYNCYETIGKYLAIFYVLGISDIIMDNIIMKNGIPVFIDFECVLKPTLKSSEKDIFPNADNFLRESVIGTGLLPFWTPSTPSQAGINFGGVGNNDLFKQSIQLLFGENGKMVFEYQNTPKASNHLPYQEEKIPSILFYKEIIQGFKNTCDFIMLNKEWVRETVTELVNRNKCSSRLLMRNTFVYDTLLKESLHPDYLTNSDSRLHFLNYLNQSFDTDCFPQELIEIEKRDLRNLDIPIFYCTPYDSIVFNENYFFSIIQECGINAMERRLNDLSETTINCQADLIAKSIACFEQVSDIAISTDTYTSSEINEDVIDLDFIKNHIIQLADSLIENSIFIDGSYQWIDISVGRVGQWEITPKKSGIYDGIDGIGLFYIYLYKITKIERFKKVSKSLLKKSLTALENLNPLKSYHLFSPFNFPFSTLYFLWHYQSVTGEKEDNIDELIEEKLIPLIKNHIHSETYFDFVNGSAGLLAFLTDYYRVNNLKRIEEVIHIIKKHIVNSAKKSKEGVSWESEKFKNLVGIAHGNAGFLIALSKYYNLFGGSSQDLEFIEKIITYNNSKFSTTANSWQDLRYHNKRMASPSWCHGASGITLSYLAANKSIGLNIDFIDWRKIYNHIVQDGFSSLHCLCHGMIGNAEAAISINNFMNQSEYNNYINRIIFLAVKKNSTELKWRTGFTNGKYSLNGLLLGTSGIGYGLLKIFNWDSIPSILTIEPPLFDCFLNPKISDL